MLRISTSTELMIFKTGTFLDATALLNLPNRSFFFSAGISILNYKLMTNVVFWNHSSGSRSRGDLCIGGSDISDFR